MKSCNSQWTEEVLSPYISYHLCILGPKARNHEHKFWSELDYQFIFMPLRRMRLFGHFTSDCCGCSWQWPYTVKNLSSKGKEVLFFSIENSKKLRLPKNYLAQNSSLGTVGNNPVLAGRMIRWLMTAVCHVSYFCDFHYDCRRGLPVSWERRALTQVHRITPKFLCLQVLIMSRMDWQKQRELKPLTPSWQAAGLGSDLQPGSFCLAPCLPCTVTQLWALLDRNHCSSCFPFTLRARSSLEHKSEQWTNKFSSVL